MEKLESQHVDSQNIFVLASARALRDLSGNVLLPVREDGLTQHLVPNKELEVVRARIWAVEPRPLLWSCVGEQEPSAALSPLPDQGIARGGAGESQVMQRPVFFF